PRAVERYLRPERRVRLGTLLSRNRAASACMDLSDGLADGIHQLGDASGVGLRIDADAVPIDAAARAWFGGRTASGDDLLAAVMTAGDDYELLVAARPRMRRRIDAVARHAAVPLTRIGTSTAEGA